MGAAITPKESLMKTYINIIRSPYEIATLLSMDEKLIN
jgi:hypothetical protein